MLAEMTVLEHSITYPATPSRGKFHNIRVHARKVMKDAQVKYACRICGYSTYVEVCHIKAIADFLSAQTISEINSLNNLVYLCPNHHYELDNRIIVI